MARGRLSKRRFLNQGDSDTQGGREERRATSSIKSSPPESKQSKRIERRKPFVDCNLYISAGFDGGNTNNISQSKAESEITSSKVKRLLNEPPGSDVGLEKFEVGGSVVTRADDIVVGVDIYTDTDEMTSSYLIDLMESDLLHPIGGFEVKPYTTRRFTDKTPMSDCLLGIVTRRVIKTNEPKKVRMVERKKGSDEIKEMMDPILANINKTPRIKDVERSVKFTSNQDVEVVDRAFLDSVRLGNLFFERLNDGKGMVEINTEDIIVFSYMKSKLS